MPLFHPYESTLTVGDQVVLFCVDCAIAAALARDVTAMEVQGAGGGVAVPKKATLAKAPAKVKGQGYGDAFPDAH